MNDEPKLDYRDPEWVAQRLGIDKNAIYRYLDEGTLPGLRLGRKWLISEASLVAALKEREGYQTAIRRMTAVKREGAVSYDDFVERTKKLPLTDEAQNSIAQARVEVLARDHNYLGQEHFILAFMNDRGSTAAKMLDNLGIDISADIEALIGRGEGLGDGQLGLTPRAARAMEFAVKEAHDSDSERIGTEHVLSGIVRSGEGIGFELLTSRGASVEVLRAEAKRLASPDKPGE